MHTLLFVYVDVVFHIMVGVTFAFSTIQPYLAVELPWGLAAAAGIKMIVYMLASTKKKTASVWPLTSWTALVSPLEWNANFSQHCEEPVER